MLCTRKMNSKEELRALEGGQKTSDRPRPEVEERCDAVTVKVYL